MNPPSNGASNKVNGNGSKKDYPSSTATGGWQVILLVDSNERCHKATKYLPHHQIVNHVNTHFNKESTGTACCETRKLMAGDYLWIARHIKTGEERVLDCIIERKSLTDLTHSLTTKSPAYYPLHRMEIQLKKLQATGLKHPWLLVEYGGNSGGFTLSPSCKQLAQHFIKEQKQKSSVQSTASDNGDDIVAVVKETKNVSGTLQFLLDQHEQMCHRMRVAYQQVCRDTNPQEAMTKLEPFASVNKTLDQLKHSIQTALDDPQFHYYLALRRVEKMGDNKAQAILKHFPQRASLTGYLSSATQKGAVKELGSLPLLGKVLATRIYETFLPFSSTQPIEKKKAAVVTPPLSTSARKRASTKSATTISSTKRSISARLALLDADISRSHEYEMIAPCVATSPTLSTLSTRKRAQTIAPILTVSERLALLDSDTTSDEEYELLRRPIFQSKPNKRQRNESKPEKTDKSDSIASLEDGLPEARDSNRSHRRRRLFSDESTPTKKKPPPDDVEVIELD